MADIKLIYLNTSNPETILKVNKGEVIKVNVKDSDFKDFYINSVYIKNIKLDKNQPEEDKHLDFKINEESHVRLYVNPLTAEYKEIKFSIFDENGILRDDFECHYFPTVVKEGEHSKYLNANSLNNDRSSFMLLRTNPKLTGNIKLVLDSKNNMYLDTIKVSDTLADKRYRKCLISGKSYFSNDVKNVFGKLPKSELYKIPDNSYDLFNVKDNYKDQINDTYSYGVKNNNDRLYPENFSLFAPLFLNDVLPDFFLIFRVDGALSEDNNMSATERMKNFLKNGKLIKSFDIRKDTPVGNYLLNAYSEFNKFPTSVYISCDDYNYNNWIGISVEEGIIKQANETTYKLSKIKNQVEFDNYITEGFERNGLINPRIINFEFLFDDNDANEFSINRYFGLYVKNNEYNKIFVVKSLSDNENSYTAADILDSNYNIISDINNSTTSLNDILNSDRIFNITTDVNVSNECYRFNSNPMTILDEKFKNLPYKNILTTPVIEEVIDSASSELNTQFITITINEPLAPGEHLRIIDNNIYDNDNNSIIDYQHSSEVFEVIAGKVGNDYYDVDDYYNNNAEELINYKDLYNENILNDESIKYLSILDNNGNIIGKNEKLCNKESIKIHRNIFAGYSNEKDFNPFGTHDKNEIIKKQIEQIVKSFNSLTNKTFVISNYDDNNISFKANDAINFLRFERISSKVIHKNENSDILEDNEFIKNDKKVITYFNNFEIPGTIISMYNKVGIEDAALLSSDFEVWGNRMGYIVNFTKSDAGLDINSGRMNSGYIYNIPINLYSTIDKISLIKNINNEYIKINDFNIQYYTFEENNDNATLITKMYKDDNVNVVKSYKNSNMYMISTDSRAYIHNNELNIYSIAPIHLNIAGILPIKDFNFNVLDKENFIGSNNLNVRIDGKDEYDKKYNDSDYIYYNVNQNEIIKLNSDKKYKIISGVAKDINTGEEYNSSDELPINIYNFKNEKEDILQIGIDIEKLDKIEEFTVKAARNNNSDEYLINYFDILNSDNFYNSGNLDSVNKKLYIEKPNADISLTIPTNCKWKLNGTDIFGNKIKMGFNFNNSLVKGNYNLLDDSKLFGFPIYKSLSNKDDSNYIYNDIMDLTYCNDGNIRTLKDKILYHNGSINEVLYSEKNNKSKYSKLYYNYDLNCLETIICGQKIILRGNNNFNLKDYNNYLFTIICSPSDNDTNKNIDIIIDKNENIILCVWYLKQNNLSYTYRNIPLFDNIYNKIGDEILNNWANVRFSHYKNIIDLSNPLNNIFPYTNISDRFNYKDKKMFICTKNNSEIFKKDFSYELFNITYKNDYLYANNIIKTSTTYNDVFDFYNDYLKQINVNDNLIDKCENKLYAYVLDTDIDNEEYVIDDFYTLNDIKKILNGNNTCVYVKNKNNVKKYYNNIINFELEDPINLSNTLLDKDITLYPGYCDPDFIDIFSFNNNETNEIIEYTKRNYISSNTSISSVNNIKQLWINKVSDQIDFITGGKDINTCIPFLGIDVLQNFDITKSSWDNNFFRRYYRENDIENFENIDGYKNPNTVKNFFGSSAINIPNRDIIINEWSFRDIAEVRKKFNESEEDVNKINILINISSELEHSILNDKDFIVNWNFNNSEMTTYATKYIKSVLEDNFIINNKNTINVYRKTLGTYLDDKEQILKYYSDNEGFELMKNLDAEIIKFNNDIYLSLDVPNALNYQYAIEYIIHR